MDKNINDEYKVPDQTRIGHVHLKVSDLEQSLEFYRDLLGFELTTMYGEQATFLSAGGYHHHIGLNTWHSKGAPPSSRSGVGLFHVAILYPERKDLATALGRLRNARHQIDGAADHGVSEAIYLRDPDNNGIELYWDRSEKDWPLKENGELEMYTRPLDIESLLNTK